MVRAVWNGAVLAEAWPQQMLFVDNRHYFPFSAVNPMYMVDSEHRKSCPWKGTEYFFHVRVNGRTNRNAAWTYYQPFRGYEFMIGYLVFNESVYLTD